MMDKEKILENLIEKVDIFNSMQDIKNDNTHTIENIIAYYGMLRRDYPDSQQFEKAKEVLMSIVNHHPELDSWCCSMTGKTMTKETQIEKESTNHQEDNN